MIHNELKEIIDLYIETIKSKQELTYNVFETKQNIKESESFLEYLKEISIETKLLIIDQHKTANKQKRELIRLDKIEEKKQWVIKNKEGKINQRIDKLKMLYKQNEMLRKQY